MSANQTKYPQLRFKGFTDPWEQRKLEKVFDAITDYVANGSFESLRKNVNSSDINGFAYLVRLQDASNNWQGPWLYTDQHGYEFLKKSRLQPDDIIMANVGSVGKFFLVPKLDKPMTLAPNAVLIKSSENDQGFLYQMMLTPEMQYKIFEKTTPGVQSKINKTDFKMIETRLPNMDEQKKIGAFFKQLDDTIALHQRKLAKLKELKQGYLQKLFPENGSKFPQLRFSGFADAWEERKLGDFIKISREQEVKKVDLHEEKIGYYVLAMRTFDFEGYIDYSKPYWINNFESADDDLFLNRKEFAIIDADMDASLPKIGKVLLNATNNKFLLAAHVRKIKVDVQVDSIFAYALMRTTELVERLKLEANGSISKRLLDKNVYKQKVYLPIHLEEQQQIGEFFWTLEETIALHQRKLEKLQELKKGYLQKMFC